MYATLCATVSVFLLCGGLTLAQGYPPGVNPSNPQDLTNRGNPQSLTVPGASNPQDLVRSPSLPRAISPAAPTNLTQAPPVSSSLGRTYTVNPAKKPPRHKRRISKAQHPKPNTQSP
jgi:hypothetical protein